MQIMIDCLSSSSFEKFMGGYVSCLTHAIASLRDILLSLRLIPTVKPCTLVSQHEESETSLFVTRDGRKCREIASYKL